jgi:hypothetical protein
MPENEPENILKISASFALKLRSASSRSKRFLTASLPLVLDFPRPFATFSRLTVFAE